MNQNQPLHPQLLSATQTVLPFPDVLGDPLVAPTVPALAHVFPKAARVPERQESALSTVIKMSTTSMALLPEETDSTEAAPQLGPHAQHRTTRVHVGPTRDGGKLWARSLAYIMSNPTANDLCQIPRIKPKFEGLHCNLVSFTGFEPVKLLSFLSTVTSFQRASGKFEVVVVCLLA